MNKKASEKIISVAFIIYLIIIGAGVILLVSSYLNTPVEVRPMENQILYNNLLNCFVDGGFLNKEILSASFNVYSNCHLNETMIKSSKIYFSFYFLNETGKKVADSVLGGDPEVINSVRTDCEVDYGKNSENFPVCLFKNETYFYVNNMNEIKTVKIVGWVSSGNSAVRNG